MNRSTPRFKLIQVQANEDFLRAYIVQGAQDYFGFSESWTEELFEKYAPEKDIELTELVNDLSQQELDSLFGDDVPKKFYHWPSDSEGEFGDTEKIPPLYTDVVQCSFDKGGLIVLESYGAPIFTLFTAEGTVLSNPCHDLHLGEDGLVMYRSAGRDPFFRVAQFDGEGLEQSAMFPPFHSEDALFPDIGLRDLIPIQDGYTAFDHERLGPKLDDASIEKCLKEQPDSWRHLIPLVSGLELAERLVTAEVIAFTLLQGSLRTNPQLVRALMTRLTEENAQTLFHFLSPKQRMAAPVAQQAIRWGNPFVHHIGIIDDGELVMENAIRNHEVLIAASEDLTSDAQFMRNICQKNWKALRYASFSFLSDMATIQKIVDAQPKEVSLEEVLNDLVNHAKHGAAILPHLPPPTNIPECIQRLKVSMKAKGDDNSAFLTALYHVPKTFKSEAAFWSKLQNLAPDFNQRAQWILGLLPEQWLSDPNRVDELVQEIPELIFKLPDELKGDAERFLRTLPKLGWQHEESIRTHIVHFDLQQDPVVMHAAAKLTRDILQIADASLLEDLNFMRSCIEITHGWCFSYASEQLQLNPAFADEVYQHNSSVRADFPPELLATGKYPKPQSDFLDFL